MKIDGERVVRCGVFVQALCLGVVGWLPFTRTGGNQIAYYGDGALMVAAGGMLVAGLTAGFAGLLFAIFCVDEEVKQTKVLSIVFLVGCLVLVLLYLGGQDVSAELRTPE